MTPIPAFVTFSYPSVIMSPLAG